MPKKQAWMTKLEKARGCVWLTLQVDRQRVVMRRSPRAGPAERQLMLAGVGGLLTDKVNKGHPSYGLLLGLLGRLTEDLAKVDRITVGKKVKAYPEGFAVSAQLCGNPMNPDTIISAGRFEGEAVVLICSAVAVLSLAEIKGENWNNRGATIQELVGALQVMTAL